MLEFTKNVLEFVFITVGLKMIIGHWLADQIVTRSRTFLGSTERNTAILSHYKLQAAHAGHKSDSVEACGDGKCMIFKTV